MVGGPGSPRRGRGFAFTGGGKVRRKVTAQAAPAPRTSKQGRRGCEGGPGSRAAGTEGLVGRPAWSLDPTPRAGGTRGPTGTLEPVQTGRPGIKGRDVVPEPPPLELLGI